jgi:hypothetical protein
MSEEMPAALTPEEEAAAMLYSVYRLQVGGVNEAGLAMPGWAQLTIPLHNAWMAVAEAARGGSPPALDVPGPPPTLWTQEDLEQLTVTDLRELCTQSGLSVPSSALKQDLIDALLASQGGAP